MWLKLNRNNRKIIVFKSKICDIIIKNKCLKFKKKRYKTKKIYKKIVIIRYGKIAFENHFFLIY